MAAEYVSALGVIIAWRQADAPRSVPVLSAAALVLPTPTTLTPQVTVTFPP